MSEIQSADCERITLISHWKIVLSSSIPLFFFLLYIEHNVGARCQEKVAENAWTISIKYATLGGYALIYLVEIWLAFGASQRSRVLHIFPITINTMALCSAFFDIFDGKFCLDTFGVPSNNGRWPQWMVTVPLLVYVALGFDDTARLSSSDIGTVISVGLSMMMGWGLTFRPPLGASVIMLILSFTCMAVMYVKAYRNVFSHSTEDIYQFNPQRIVSKHIKSMKCCLLLLLCVMMLPFPIIYLLSMTKVISKEVSIVSMAIAGSLAKISFTIAIITANSRITSAASVIFMDEYEATVRANDSKRNYMRSVFHDVRVPLNSMVMGLSVFESSNHLTPDEREALLVMQQACDFMTETLNGVLSMEKIEAGEMTLDYKVFRVASLTNRVKKTLAGAAHKKCILLKSYINEDLPTHVIGDRFRLEHVLANLISNAIKFSPLASEVGIRVWALESSSIVDQTRSTAVVRNGFLLTTDEHPVPKVTLCFSVSDSGPGISFADQANLFKPFHQVNAGALQQGGGTGLGLAITKEIVQLHGGSIRCESEVGRGTKFIVTIPFSLPAQTDNNADSSINNSMVSSVHKSAVSSNYNSAAVNSCDNQPLSFVAGSRAQQGTANVKDSQKRMEATKEKGGLLTRTPSQQRLLGGSDDGSNDDYVDDDSNDDEDIEAGRITEEKIIRGVELTTELTVSNIPASVAQNPNASPEAKYRGLIVDDTSSNRKMLRMLLLKRGIKCEEKEDGQQAVDSLLVASSIQHFDVVFMDRYMPVMTGLEATRALRASGYDRFIVGLTGSTFDDEVREFLTSGVDVVLSKPFTPTQCNALLAHMEAKGTKSHPHEKWSLGRKGKLVRCDL